MIDHLVQRENGEAPAGAGPGAGVERVVAAAREAEAERLAHRDRVRRFHFDTIAVHGVYGMAAAMANHGSIMEPLTLAPAQHFLDSDSMEAALAYLVPSWTYSRIANPTNHYLEETLALLEGYGFAGETSACLTASGMAAVALATSPFLAVGGDRRGWAGSRPNIVASAHCYGGTFQLFQERYAGERGIDVRWVGDPQDASAWARLVDEETRFVYGEMPSNPTLALFDIAAVAGIAHERGVPLIVDATVATPALMRPLLHGADIVVHSVSKSIAASGLIIAGAIVARHDIPSRIGPDELRHDFATYAKLLPGRDTGPALSPFNALMAINDLRTLRSRMDVLSRSTLHIAEQLEGHPAVASVSYPGLPSAPNHALARRYLRLVDAPEDDAFRAGHLLGFTLRAGPDAARRVLDRLELIWRATDLGRIKSVAVIPAISTHQQQGEAGRLLAHVPSNLIRLSVGGEHPDDVMADLEQALTTA
jgi:O-acetylhomoserine/O-acetylserine sulfhydrylase-like pyridoxal-dependent enzyme